MNSVRINWFNWFLLGVTLLLSLNTLFAKEIPAKSDKLVNDYAGVLSNEDRTGLEQMLVAYFDSTSTQIAVVIESSLEDDDLFDYCQRLATAWGIGEQGKNNGVLLYIAIEDRKVRIHTGYGMEATITDALSKRIIEQHIKPNFKVQDYAQGIYEAVNIIMRAASGEYINTRESKGKKTSLLKVIVVIIIILFVLSKFGGGRGGMRSRGGFGGPVFWGGTFGSGGFSSGGGGFGGGGFGGFGGGGFGGGGSSGSW